MHSRNQQLSNKNTCKNIHIHSDILKKYITTKRDIQKIIFIDIYISIIYTQFLGKSNNRETETETETEKVKKKKREREESFGL